MHVGDRLGVARFGLADVDGQRVHDLLTIAAGSTPIAQAAHDARKPVAAQMRRTGAQISTRWSSSSLTSPALDREMLGKQRADRCRSPSTKPSASRSCRACVDQVGDDAVPGFLRHLGVDAGVGDHFGIALGQRHEDQHAGALGGDMDVAGQELLQRIVMRAAIAQRARHEPDAQSPERAQSTSKRAGKRQKLRRDEDRQAHARTTRIRAGRRRTRLTTSDRKRDA